MKYQFSLPMPYTIEDIQSIWDINNIIEKSAITSMFACVPDTCNLYTGFEQNRNSCLEHSQWDYWKKLIGYVLSKNCDFIYLLNSPRPVEQPVFAERLEKLDKLLNELKEIGVQKLRISDGMLMDYISHNYPDFKIFASTSFEYKTIWEYQNFFIQHPTVKQFVPAHDINKNFKLLSLLKKRYPNIDIEIMANEGCLHGCPNRIAHSMSSNNSVTSDFCCYISDRKPFHCISVGTTIYPWDIKEYAKIGINNFKLVGRDSYNDFKHCLNLYKKYLMGVDDVKYIENDSFSILNYHLAYNPVLQKLTIKEYGKYLPKIERFKKQGHLCSSICGIECKYCYVCADKIQKKYIQNKKNEQKK